MKIGNYNIHSIETGRFALDGGAMFGIVPKVIWNKTNPSDHSNRIEMALRSLLIIGENRKILVDTGIGFKYEGKFKEIYKIDYSRYSLLNSLKNYNTSSEEITDVILTHLHFDHAGGNTIIKNGDLQPAFPSATYYIQEGNLEHALKPNEKDKASYLSENFKPLISHNLLKIIKGETELFPGIELLVVTGHTLAQQLVKISDGNKTLLYCADLIPTSSHIPIPYVMGYDLHPMITIEEKKKILRDAVDNNWILFYEHDPFVEASEVVFTEKGFFRGNKVSLINRNVTG